MVQSIQEAPARTFTLGDAPELQTAAGGQWVQAWVKPGTSIMHKADVTNSLESWTALKYTQLIPSSLVGGDIYRGDLGVSGQSAATSSVKQEIDGKEAIRFELAQSATAVSLDLSRLYSSDDGTAFNEGGRVRLFAANGDLVSESFFTGSNTGGTQHVDVQAASLFKSVEISAGVLRGDGSFSHGGYADASADAKSGFGSEIFTDGANAQHGSEFLLDKITFEYARPVSTGESYNLAEDVALKGGSVLGNDTDPDGQPLSAMLVSSPSHGALTLNPDGSFVYTPQANYFGPDSFVYRATDGQDVSLSATVALNVKSVNDAPVAGNDKTSTNEDTPVSGNLINGSLGGIDTDADGDTLVIAPVGTISSSKGASVVLNANGTFTYDPRVSSELQALNTGTSVQDSFNYTVSDGNGGTSTATVVVQVAGVTETNTDVLLPSIAPGTELQYFVKFEGNADFGQWLDLGSFSVGLSALAQGGGGLGVGKLNAQDLALVLGASNTAVDLTEALFEGEGFTSVNIEGYKTGAKGELLLVDEYLFENTLVSSVSSGGSGGNLASQVTVNYGKVGFAHIDYDAQGKARDTTGTTFDLGNNASSAGPEARADAVINGKIQELGEQVPLNTERLSYYLNFDGNPAHWVELDALSLGFSNSGTFQGAGKTHAADVNFSLGSNELTNVLTSDLLKGTEVAHVAIQVYTPDFKGGADVLVESYAFDNVLFNSLSTSSGGTSNISFAYERFAQTHIGRDSKGIALPANKLGWDLVDNEQSTPAAALAKSDVLPTVPGDVLRYIIKFEGAGLSADWLELSSFSTGIASTGGLGALGVTPGKVSAQDLSFVLGASNTAVAVTEALLNGAHITNVNIEGYRTNGGTFQLVDEYLFTDVLATSIGSNSNGQTNLFNAISVNYGSYGYAHQPYGANGKTDGSARVVGWDFIEGKGGQPADGKPTGAAFLEGNKLGEQALGGSGLHTYIKFDGSAGWLELSGLSVAGISNSGTAALGGGKLSFQDIFVTLGSSSELPNLVGWLAAGKELSHAEIEVYGGNLQNGKATLVDEYRFDGVLLTSLNAGATSGGNAVNVSFAYERFTELHTGISSSGKLLPVESYGWDLLKNSDTTVSNALDKVSSGQVEVPSSTGGLDYYIRIGDSSGKGGDWLELAAFSTGVYNTSILGNGGFNTGKSQAQDFSFTLGSSKTGVDLTELLLKGDGPITVNVEGYRRGQDGNLQLVDEYLLGNAFVTSVASGGSNGQGLTSNFSVDYGKLGYSHVPYDDSGKSGKATGTTWDFDLGKSSQGPATNSEAAADVANAKLGEQVPVGATGLAYYVKFDGAEGWLDLAAFSLSLSRPSTDGVGGPSIGKVSALDVAMTLGGSGELVGLTELLTQGKQLANVEVEVYASGSKGQRVLVDEYKFENVYMTSFQTSQDVSNNISFSYEKFTETHIGANANGKAMTPDIAGWDFLLGQVYTAPFAGVPDLFG